MQPGSLAAKKLLVSKRGTVNAPMSEHSDPNGLGFKESSATKQHAMNNRSSIPVIQRQAD